MILLLIAVFAALLMLRLPIAFALGMACLAYAVGAGIPLTILPLKMYSGIDVFVLLSIPGFILAGNIMNEGGITARIIAFCNHLLGHIRGGLALANIGASMIFAGISGTAVADTASIGAVMIPAMRREGYDNDFSCAITAASSTVGPIIPPSVPMIIAGTLSGLSVGRLFLAGAIPGLMLGLGLMGLTWLIARRKKFPKLARSSWRTRGKGFLDAFWALMMTVIILVGIIGGIFTPTEASIIAVVYALVIGWGVYKRLNLNRLAVVTIDSMRTSASLMILVGFANLFGWILITEQVPQRIASGLLDLTQQPWLLLILINLLLIVIGTFMETIAALLIMFPLLLKVALAVGIDPVQFAVIAVLNLIIGLTTPPVGVCLFVAASIGKTSVGRVARAGWPFLLLSLLVLVLVSAFPQLSLWLPTLFYD